MAAMGIDLTGFTIRAASIMSPAPADSDPTRFVLVHYAEAAKPRSGHYGDYESFIRDFVSAHRELTGQPVTQVGLAWDDHHSGHGERSTVHAICEALAIRVLGTEQATTAAMRSNQCELQPSVTAHWPRETFEESRPAIGVAVAAARPTGGEPDWSSSASATDTTTPDDESSAERPGAVANPGDSDPQLLARLDAALAQVAQQEAISQALRESVDQGLREATRREARVVELSERLDTLQHAHAAELARAHSRRESMQAEVATMRASFQDQKAHAEQAVSGLEDLQVEAAEQRQELAAHEEALAQHDRELTESRAALQEQRAELDRRQETIDSLRGELTDVRSELDQVRSSGLSDEEIEAQKQQVAEAFDAGAALGERAARRVIELEEQLQRLAGADSRNQPNQPTLDG